MTVPLAFPLAEIFPEMEGEEFKALVADIKAHGLREPITMFEDLILDGRNRHRACIVAKVEPRFEEFKGDRAAALAFVVSKNIHRRHLTPKQKRNALVKIVAVQPEKSDRALGKDLGVHHSAIGRARKAGEASGAVAPVGKRKGADGRTRRRPVKPAKKADGKAATEAQKAARAREEARLLALAEAEPAAWLRDHPGNPLPEHLCSLRGAAAAEYDAWAKKYYAATGAEDSGSIERLLAEARKHVNPATAPVTTGATAATALVWKTPRSRSRGMKPEDSIEAKTSGGKYRVYKTVGNCYSVNYSPKGEIFVRQLALDLASQEDAKAVAQSDFERSKPEGAAAPAKPVGKREAKRLAKEQHQEVMGQKGEDLAKAIIARDRELARLLADIISDNDSREAFEQIIEGEFGVHCYPDGRFMTVGDNGRTFGWYDSWIEASHAIDAAKAAKGTS
jgi:hypothetical protein